MNFDANNNMCSDTPSDIIKESSDIEHNLLPDKSGKRYNLVYQQFKDWQSSKKTTSTGQDMILVYLKTLKTEKHYAPPTLWSTYSMLKKTLLTKENVDISNYAKVNGYLKKNSVGYKSNQAKSFSAQQLEKFFNEAPDQQYLAVKVACILGLKGGLRRSEITELTIDCIESLTSDKGTQLLKFNIPKTKTHESKSFVIEGAYITIIERYRALRPDNVQSNRFFLRYQNGKCCNQNIGINTIGKMPREVADFLELPNSHLYTGHSWRVTSTTMLADAGASKEEIKRHGKWKSDQVAERYVAESIFNKEKTANMITKYVKLKPSNCTTATNNAVVNSTSESEASGTAVSAGVPNITKIFHINNCSNVTFN